MSPADCVWWQMLQFTWCHDCDDYAMGTEFTASFYMLSLRRSCSTWRVRCQGWCLWSPSPPVCSGGTAHSVWRGSVPSGPSCWHELASLSALQSHSDSRSPLRTIITSLIIWCSSDDVYSNQDTVCCLFCINVDKLLQDALWCLNRHTVYL